MGVLPAEIQAEIKRYKHPLLAFYSWPQRQLKRKHRFLQQATTTVIWRQNLNQILTKPVIRQQLQNGTMCSNVLTICAATIRSHQLWLPIQVGKEKFAYVVGPCLTKIACWIVKPLLQLAKPIQSRKPQSNMLLRKNLYPSEQDSIAATVMKPPWIIWQGWLCRKRKKKRIRKKWKKVNSSSSKFVLVKKKKEMKNMQNQLYTLKQLRNYHRSYYNYYS